MTPLETQLKWIQEANGNLQDYDCPICRNKGFTFRIKDEEIVSRLCKCMEIRKGIREIRESGIGEKDLDTFKTNNDFQKSLLKMAKDYLLNGEERWFFIGGQSGCGKSHLCTGILRELACKGKTIAFMSWVPDTKRLVDSYYDGEYSRIMARYKNVDVLYIDDLFKQKRGEKLSNSQITIAYDIINHRELNNKKTIISSEYLIDDIVGFDEAIGSRIYGMSDKYIINIASDQKRNFRMN